MADHGGGDVEDNLYEGAVSLCSALECEFSEVRLCKSCNMHFCDEMHALYDGGHRLQTLRNGLRVQDKHGTTSVSQIERTKTQLRVTTQYQQAQQITIQTKR